MQRKKLGRKLLSFLLTLAMVVGLMPGMGLTAYAAEVESEEFTTNMGAGTYTGTHIKITGTASMDGDGDFIGKDFPWTIQGLSGETITRVDMTIGYYGGYSYVSYFRANHGTLSNINDSNGGGFSFIDVNSTSITIDCDSNDHALQIKKVVVYYSAGSSSVAVTGVTLNPSTAQTIDVDGKVSFTTAVEPDDATDKTVKWSVGGTDASAVKLYTDEACTTEVGTDATETLTVYAKGISAGSATITATSNADDTKTAECAVTVNKADPTAPTGLTATYGQTLADVMLPTGWTWADSTQSVGNVVSPAVTFKANFAGNDNYNAASNVDVAVTVSKADATTAMQAASVSIEGTSGNTATVSYTLPDGASYGAVTNSNIEFFTVDTTNGLVLTAAKSWTASDWATDASKTFTVAVSGATNYNNYTLTVTVTPTYKATQTITAADVTATYGDTGVKINASTSGDGTLSYAVKSGDAVTVDASGNLTINKAGSAVITVTAAETDTYAQATQDVNVTVNTKTMTVSAEDVNVTVDGQPHGITVTVTDPASGATVKYGTEEGSYTIDASPTQTEVGEKTVYYQVTADNYTTYTGSAKVTVSAKQTQTITAENVTAAYGDTGKSIDASTSGDGTLSYAVKSGDAVTVNETTGALTIVKAGSAVITVTAAETDTYAQATKDVNVTVNTKTMTVSAEDVNVTVDGQAHGITVTVTDPASGATVKYGTEAGSYTLDASPTQTEVGEKTVYYQVTADNYTTYTGSAKVTVSAKQTQTITAENVTAAYGDTGKSIDASTSGDGTLSYAVKSGDAVTVNETTGALTIVKAGSAVITVTANNRTYDGTDKPLVTVDNSTLVGGEMQYAFGTATEATEQYTTSIPTATNAGTYFVWYKIIGDNNHNDSESSYVSVTVDKASSIPATIMGKNIEYSETVQDLVNITGVAVGGTMQYAFGSETEAFGTFFSTVPTTEDIGAYGTFNIWYKVVGDDNHYDSEAECVTTTVLGPISSTITFKVVNGSWDDGTTADKTVTLTGYEGETLKLAANQIPSVGTKPNDTYKAGNWDVTPNTTAAITGATTYTYTYSQKNSISQTVTFKVVNGSWNDETTTDKTVTLTGYEGDTLKLAATDIPAVGTKPNDTYKAGSWDVTPSTDTAITEATTYTYTYVAKEASVVTKAPEAKTLTYNGSAQELVIAGEATDGEMQYALGTATEATQPYTTSIPIGTTAGTYYVWYKVVGDDNHNDSVSAYVTSTIRGEISQTITFKVVNGSWNDGTTTDKTVNLNGYEGDTLKLTATDIPAVGNKPDDAYEAGSWDITPDTETAITAATTYTYTYVHKESTEGEVTFNKGEGSDETPKTVVESVESSDLTEFAETQKEEGKEVKVELEITPKKEEDIAQTSGDGTKQIAEGLFVGLDNENIVTEYFDIDLTKYVDEVKQDNISDTGSPIEIALKYDPDKMFDPVVVRTHNGETVEFSKLSARPAKADYKDATYYVGDGVIYIYSRYFSDYAIIYTTVKTYNVDIITNTGSNLSKTVAEGSKVDLPIGLSKNGYTFAGWFSDEACTKVWNVNDTVSADIKIYALWIQNTVPYVPSTPVETPTTTPTPTVTPAPTVVPTVTPAPVKDSITAEEAARGAIKLNAGLKVYPNDSDVVVKWGKVDNADRYVIYAAYCKKGRKCAKIATLDGDANTYIFSELNGKAINTKKNIKLYVVAYRKVNGKYKKITSSITAHIVGSGSKKYSNVKGIKVESTKITLSLDDNTAAPSSYTLNLVAVLKDSSKKMLLHTEEFRYATSKSSVATVGKDGTITAKGKGTCYIYVYAQNGYAKKIKVTVK